MAMLTLAYRPHRFADLVGQDQARAILQALVHSTDVPAALLFGGASGTGKTTAARLLAAALNCEQPRNGDCCATCASCLAVQAGSAVSVHEVDAASNGGVDDIRALQDLARYSTGGPWRVIVLDEAHAMRRASFNALLKVLEEPPARTVFVLCTTEPEQIIATVRSRAMPITFKPVPPDVIARRLRTIADAAQIRVDAAVLAAIADAAEGGVRDAVMLLDQARRVGVATLDDLAPLLGRTDHPRLILSALVNGEHAQARAHLSSYLTQTGDLAELISGLIADLQDRYATHTLDHRRMVAATRLLWEARSIPTSPARVARSQAEALVTLLSAVLGPPDAPIERPGAATPIPRVTKSPKSAETSQPEDRLDLDALVDLLSSE